jgi:carbon-monoxide dehydrogenase large subunit
VRRKEDFRFLTGQGTYTDDINRPGQLHAFLLRSTQRLAGNRISGLGSVSAEQARRLTLPCLMIH